MWLPCFVQSGWGLVHTFTGMQMRLRTAAMALSLRSLRSPGRVYTWSIKVVPEMWRSPPWGASVLPGAGSSCALWSVGPLGFAGAAPAAPGAPRCAPRPFLAPQAVHFLQIPGADTCVLFTEATSEARCWCTLYGAGTSIKKTRREFSGYIAATQQIRVLDASLSRCDGQRLRQRCYA